MNRDNDQSASRRNKKKKPENNRSSDEVANHRNKCEVLEIDLDDHEENEKKNLEEEFSS